MYAGPLNDLVSGIGYHLCVLDSVIGHHSKTLVETAIHYNVLAWMEIYASPYLHQPNHRLNVCYLL